MHDSELVEIYAAADAAEAHLVRMRLEDEGIAARVVGDALEVGSFPVGNATPRVWVHSADEARARLLMVDLEAHRRAHAADPDDEEGADPDDADDDFDVGVAEFEANEP